MTEKGESRMTVYEIVTEKILESLRNGVAPWKKPWNGAGARNWETQRSYSGINVFLLEPGEYATFNQIQKAGGRIKQGEKGHLVVFWKLLEKGKAHEDDKSEKVPLLRYYRVWEIGQCEGLKSKAKVAEHDPIPEAEAVAAGFKDAPRITPSGSAWYRPEEDKVGCPDICNFKQREEFYCTLFHELVHSTGHPSRLGRFVSGVAAFGGERYSKEELVAEMGAAMLCGHCGLSPATIENSAAYVGNWLAVLKNDPKMVVQAAAKAQAAANYILGVKEARGE
jgi:antirestriction protein ArdC